MRGLTHTTINTAAWLTGIAAYQQTNRPATIAATAGTILVVATSRLPDVDHAKSGPGYRMNRLIPGLPKYLEEKFGVRKSPLHWGLIPILIGVTCSILATQIHPSLWWTGIAIGGSWWMHIAADCLTWMGAPLIAPLSFKMIRPRYGYRFKTGGRFERCIVFVVALIWCGLATSAVIKQLII